MASDGAVRCGWRSVVKGMGPGDVGSRDAMVGNSSGDVVIVVVSRRAVVTEDDAINTPRPVSSIFPIFTHFSYSMTNIAQSMRADQNILLESDMQRGKHQFA